MNKSIADRLRTRGGVALVSLTVGVVAVVLYLPTLSYDFVREDKAQIVHRSNSKISDIFLPGLQASVPSGLASEGETGCYRPVTALSFLLDRKVARTNPWYFHLVNVVLAAGSAVLVVLIVWELLHSGVWAGIAGLLFATHPSHVEPVAFVSARAELLTALFLSFAGFALLRSFRKRNRRWWLVVPFGYALALLSKESALLFPLLVLLTPFFIQSRFPRRFWLVLLALGVIGIGYFVLSYQICHRPFPLEITPLRFLNLANTFGLYVRMFFPFFEHQVKILRDPAFLKLTLFFLYAMLFLIAVPLAALRRRFRIGLWGYFWVILFLLPVSGIAATGPQAAERFLFLPSVGMIVLVITLFSRLLVAQHGARRFVGFGLVALAGLFAWDSRLRLPVWRDEKSLFLTMVKEVPQDPGAYFGLGRVLQSALPDSAIILYKRAILLDQGFVPAHINIARLYSEKGDHRRAIHHLRLADELNPGAANIQTELGFAFLYSGQRDSALAAFRRAQAIDSVLLPAKLGAGLVLVLAGDVEWANGDWAQLRETSPGGQDSVRQIVGRMAQSRNYERALDQLGKVLVAFGDTSEAEGYYRRALEVDSNCVGALYNLAVLLARRGETTQAVGLAHRAAKLRPKEETIQSFYRTLQNKNQKRNQSR